MTRRCRRFEVGVVATQDIFPRKSLRLSCGVDRIQVRPQPATASVKNIVDLTESERRNEIRPQPRVILQPRINVVDEDLRPQKVIKIYV